MSDRKTIETAPRDGTDLLFWDGLSHELGHWLDWDDGTGDWVDRELLPLRPTHWMRLPDPPNKGDLHGDWCPFPAPPGADE